MSSHTNTKDRSTFNSMINNLTGKTSASPKFQFFFRSDRILGFVDLALKPLLQHKHSSMGSKVQQLPQLVQHNKQYHRKVIHACTVACIWMFTLKDFIPRLKSYTHLYRIIYTVPDRKVLLSSSHLNCHTLGFYLQTQDPAVPAP